MSRPRILFLHGGGTNSPIFQIQSRHLASALAPEGFELVYPTGPITCPAGPGVLPFFAAEGPYAKWMWDGMVSDAEWAEESTMADSVDHLVNILDTQGPFCAIVGFSQGAKCTVHLLRHLQKTAPRKLESIKIAVLVCGTAPFQAGYVHPDGWKAGGDLKVAEKEGTDERRVRGFDECVGLGLIKGIESVHVIGEEDPFRLQGEKLVDFFEPRGRRVYRFKGGHSMPADKGVNDLLRNLIVSAYEDDY